MEGKSESQLISFLESKNGDFAKALMCAQRQQILAALPKVNLSHVTVLNLITEGQNDLDNVDFLSKLNLNNIERLLLASNKIPNLKWLPSLHIPKLNHLELSNNLLKDFSELSSPNLKHVSNIELNGNQIQNLEPITKIDLTNLRQLGIAENPVSDVNPLLNVDFQGHPNFKLLLCENPLSEKSRQTIRSFGQDVSRRIFQYYL